MAALALCLILWPAEASAQRGEKTLGVAGGFASYNTSGMVDIYFQYSFAEHVRIAPDVGYVFQNKGKSGFMVNVDMHFPFRVAKGLKLYPLAGITFNNWSYSATDSSVSRGGFNAGAGLDIYFTSQLKMSIQGKYSLMKDTHGAYATVGFGYTF